MKGFCRCGLGEYLKPKSEFHGFYRFAQTKKPPVSPDGSPFPIWFILSFLLLYYFLCAMGCFPNHRLCPDWLQDIFLTYCLNSKNHYLPFLTLRHDVANFLFWICFIPAPYKIHFTTPCRKLFCMLQNLPCDIVS